MKAIFRTQIKPELNKLYTEPPTLTDDGDWGWFCREHALHTYFLAKLFGFHATIRRGDLIGKLPSGGGINSAGCSSDHVWCQIEDVVPVDLSATFEYFIGFPSIALVFGAREGRTDVVDYVAEHFDGYAVNRVQRPVLAYREKQMVALTDQQLLDDPYSFLNPGGWGKQFGLDIFNKITLHLFEVACGRSQRMLVGRRGTEADLRTIRARYPDATGMIKTALGYK
ncbi:MAG: hypothetical protein C0483_24210 [Pirellula sp.]|nr:hypothetical protein [Pirellula sp.]